MQTWAGKPEAEFVRRFGPPANSYVATDGSRSLVFMSYWNNAPEYPCKITLQVAPDGKIAGWHLQTTPVGIYGDSCGGALGSGAIGASMMYR